MAIDENDPDLMAIDASHLFAAHTTWIGFRRGTLLRKYMYDFAQLLAPHLDRRLVERAHRAAAAEEVGAAVRRTSSCRSARRRRSAARAAPRRASAGLVGDVVALPGAPRGRHVLALRRARRHRSRSAPEEHQILPHAGAHGAQLAAETEALAQEPSLRVAAALAGAGNSQRDQRQAGQRGGELLDPVGRCETHAQAGRAPGERPGRRAAPRAARSAHPRLRTPRPGSARSSATQLTPPQDVAHRPAP